MTNIPYSESGGKGTWHSSTLRLHDRDSIQLVTLSCPICARDIPLTGRPIYEDGMVPGIIACKSGCGWKSEVRLLGWSRPL